MARHITHLLSKAIGRDMHASMPQAQWLTRGGLKFTLNPFKTFANLLIDCHEERINQSSTERYTIRHFS